VTRTPLSRSKCQRVPYCGGLPHNFLFITSARGRLICLPLSVCRRILMKFWRGWMTWQQQQTIGFGWWSGSRYGSGNVLTEFLPLRDGANKSARRKQESDLLLMMVWIRHPVSVRVVQSYTSVTKQYILMSAKRRWYSSAGKVTAGLARKVVEDCRRVMPSVRSRANWSPRTAGSVPEPYARFEYGLLFIARQHTCARRARYCFTNSVCLSVQCRYVSKRMDISSGYLTTW